jgi:GGDEF domain-containing protein
VAVQLSIGICHLGGGDAHTALGRADLAMYTAKRRRSGIEHYDPARDGVPQPRGVRPAVRHRDRSTAACPGGGAS